MPIDSPRSLSAVEMPTYTARYENDGRFWFVRIVELERGAQARDYDEIENVAANIVTSTLDVPADSFRLAVQDGTASREDRRPR